MTIGGGQHVGHDMDRSSARATLFADTASLRIELCNVNYCYALNNNNTV